MICILKKLRLKFLWVNSKRFKIFMNNINKMRATLMIDVNHEFYIQKVIFEIINLIE